MPFFFPFFLSLSLPATGPLPPPSSDPQIEAPFPSLLPFFRHKPFLPSFLFFLLLPSRLQHPRPPPGKRGDVEKREFRGGLADAPAQKKRKGGRKERRKWGKGGEGRPSPGESDLAPKEKGKTQGSEQGSLPYFLELLRKRYNIAHWKKSSRIQTLYR